jgi:hypothetical protein
MLEWSSFGRDLTLFTIIDSWTVYGDAQGEPSAATGQDHARKAKASHCSIPTFEIDGNVSRLLCRSRSSSASSSVILLAWKLIGVDCR